MARMFAGLEKLVDYLEAPDKIACLEAQTN